MLAGEVYVDGQVALKPGLKVHDEAQVVVRERLPYVSRGGLKLAAALDGFRVVGAGRGLRRRGRLHRRLHRLPAPAGRRPVYAIDVGYGQLAWQLRRDQRVVVMERTNVRYVETLPEPVRLVAMDASFISLGLLLPPSLAGWPPARTWSRWSSRSSKQGADRWARGSRA